MLEHEVEGRVLFKLVEESDDEGSSSKSFKDASLANDGFFFVSFQDVRDVELFHGDLVTSTLFDGESDVTERALA